MKKNTLRRNCRARQLRSKRRNPAGSLVMPLAAILTVVWFGFEAILLIFTGLWCKFSSLELNTFGDFLAGTFAPVAVIWFVATFYLQKVELSLQRHELKLQRKETARLALQATRQADSIEASEKLTKRESFLRFAAFLIEGMNLDVVTTLKFILGAQEVSERRGRWGRSDWSFYYEQLLQTFVEQEQGLESFLKTNKEWNKIHKVMVRFSKRYEKLLNECDLVDEKNKHREEYEQSEQALIYMAFACVLRRASPFKFQLLPTFISDLR